jgi:methionyl aminopeptidase
MSIKDKKSWDIVVEVLQELQKRAIVGANCVELDKLAEKIINDAKGVSFNKNYKPEWAPTPFPASVCFSINNEVAHGFPTLDDGTPKILKDGDIINLDVSVKKDNVCADASITVGVGDISSRNERLLYYAKKTLEEGIKQVRAGVKIGEVSRAMELCANRNGFVLNKNLTGHGIGSQMHEEPKILNFYDLNNPLNDYILKEGQHICLEPQLTYKDTQGVMAKNGWTIETTDGKNSAFYEKMVKVTLNGSEILTNW